MWGGSVNILQYSCPGKIPWAQKPSGLQSVGMQGSWTWLKWQSMHACVCICTWHCFRFQWPVFSSQHWHGKSRLSAENACLRHRSTSTRWRTSVAFFKGKDTVWSDGTLTRLFGHRLPFIKHILMRYPNSALSWSYGLFQTEVNLFPSSLFSLF